MNAWLLTWEWFGDHAKVIDPFIGIISGSRSSKRVADFV